MAIYTSIPTATSMAGMTFFGWMTKRFNEYTSLTGIGFVLFMLGLVAAWYSRRVTDADAAADGTTFLSRGL
jgi:hypothetical protein